MQHDRSKSDCKARQCKSASGESLCRNKDRLSFPQTLSSRLRPSENTERLRASMREALKLESTKLVYSLVFFAIVLFVLWFLYPRLLERGSQHHTGAFWKAEREANKKR